MNLYPTDKASILYDPEDEDLVMSFSWYLQGSYLVTYRTVKTSKYSKESTQRLNLAREIAKQMFSNLGREPIEFSNGNPLDVRRSNIKVKGKRKKPSQTSLRKLTSPEMFKGVTQVKNNPKKPYRAFFSPTKKSLGYYATPLEAARAYNKEVQEYYTGTDVDYQKFLNVLPISYLDVYDAFDAQPFVDDFLSKVNIFPDLKTHAELLSLVHNFKIDSEKLFKYRQGKTPIGIQRGSDPYTFNKGLEEDWELSGIISTYETVKFTVKLDGYNIKNGTPSRSDWVLPNRYTLIEALKIVNTLIPYALGKDFPLNELNHLGSYFQAFLKIDLEAFKSK